MSIMKDMDLIYDLKMWRPDKRSRLKGTYEAFVGRMNPGTSGRRGTDSIRR